MKIVAIIPVKTFSKAKTRLNLSLNQREDLCRLMLEEVLATISNTKNIDKIIVVSKDEEALKLTKKFGVKEIFDDDESGVNHAVSLADSYLENNEWDTSIVFPQDIPFMLIQKRKLQYLQAAGIEVSSFGLAKMYSDVCSNIVIDTKDKALTKKIQNLDINVFETKIKMNNKIAEQALASYVLNQVHV